MGKIILNLALSLDGYIAYEDGGFDWIIGEEDGGLNTKEKFNFSDFLESVDTIVMGSKAYADTPDESISSFSNKKIILASSKQIPKPSNVEIINGDICTRVLELKEMYDRDIWLFGGGLTIDPFIKANIIDEYIIGIIPIILGRGKKLFLDSNPTIKLHLEKSIIDNGIVLLFYSKRMG